MLAPDATLVDVAFAVGTALARAEITAVLTGGSAAAYYVPRALQSHDADFVFAGGDPDVYRLRAALQTIGFRAVVGGFYAHAAVPFTVAFPRGPLAIGRDLVRGWATQRRGDERLCVLSVTDSVRDRFLHFWAWRDRSALEAALAVARAHRRVFDRDGFVAWTERERAADRTYDAGAVRTFLERLDEDCASGGEYRMT